MGSDCGLYRGANLHMKGVNKPGSAVQHSSLYPG